MINKNGIITCDVCGVTSNEKIVRWVGRAGMHLCSKHKKQIYEYGKVTDPTRRTTQDKNEYLIFDDHAEIVLRDKQNNVVAHALIDLEDVDKCKLQKWHLCKKAHNQNYVRTKNTKINESIHRYILDYKGPLVVDHINRDPLDNRKCNLRIATVAENTANNGHPGIYQIANGKWKVKLRRYGKQYYSEGRGFDTYKQAVKFRDDILEYIDTHRNELKAEYDQARAGQLPWTCLMPNGTWQTTYYVDGKRVRESGFPTSEAASNRRAEMMGVVGNAG